jgi:Domain of unknown function (DUF4262)
MFGLHLRDIQSWLNRLGKQIHAGKPLMAGQRRDGVLEGYALEIRPVHNSWYPRLFGSAVNFYQRPPLPIVQSVWPDRTGAGVGCRACRPRLVAGGTYAESPGPASPVGPGSGPD